VSNVKVEVPAQADQVSVVRSVVAGVGAQHGLSVDAIEDLRLAVDEACGQLLRMVPSGTHLIVEVMPGEGRIEVVASIDGNAPATARNGPEEFLTWHILGALTDGAALEERTEGIAIRFSKAMPA
jgi:serine/threonine-protein kinase RsbW